MANTTIMTITHVATQRTVQLTNFFVTEFLDNIDTKYNFENVYGRMDPIATYQGTTRKISLGIRYQGATKMEAAKSAANTLMRFQYPVYSNQQNSLSISRPPLVLVEFGDWIKGSPDGYEIDGTDTRRLLCAMQGFDYTPAAGFTPEDSPYIRFGRGTKFKLTPTNLSMKFDFIVLHDKTIGYDNFGKWTGGADWGPGIAHETSPPFGQNSIGDSPAGANPPDDNTPQAQQQADADSITGGN